ncbi:MAG TPA: sulfatase-like hydrolase/transferase [Bryobacteraceae bacterium]|nr:sulfatase-like hydrolase/transferase [Bryobacteraceae bacterium]
MTRRQFVGSAAFAAVAPANRFNLVLVTFDQLRSDCLGITGNPVVNTPVIDALARRGVLFMNNFCQAPQCVPSRMSIHTGRYPHTHRTLLNSYRIPDDEPTLARILSAAGYRTVVTGERPFAPRDDMAGFERRLEKAPGKDHGSLLAKHGWAGPDIPGDRQAKLADFKRLHDVRYQASAVPWPEELDESKHFSDLAIEFLEEKNDKPYFLHISYRRPHHPFDPPAPYDTMYKGARFPATKKKPGEMANKPPAQQRAMKSLAGFDPSTISSADLDLIKAFYYGMITLGDKHLGRVLDGVSLDNTVVVFTADHGEMLGDHGLLLKGSYMYDQVVHTPLVFAGPGVPRGVRVDGLTESVDIAPTIAELLGFPLPWAQGKSLKHLFGNPRAPHKQAVHSEFPAVKMVRTATHKLVHYPGARYGELYDLKRDPDEYDNLYDDPAQAESRAGMYARLADWLLATRDPMRAPVQDSPG